MADYIVKPLQKALDVLRCIGQIPEPMSLKDISLRVGMPKTSVLRYLRTFEAAGIVVHEPDRNIYRLDTRLLGMVNLAYEVGRLREICLPHMQFLQRVSGETINLGVMEGSDVVYIEIIEGAHMEAAQARVGGRHPAHTTALGKAMLAHMPAEARIGVLPRVLRRRTQRSIFERRQLFAELDQISARGFAEDDRENEDGAICLGVPLLNAAGCVTSAISIAAPCRRASDAWRARVLPHLIAHASGISRELGYQGSLRRARQDR